MKTFRMMVRGSGHFPFDMLRYDRCWPATTADAIAVDMEDLPDRIVTVEGTREFSEARWLSFGWKRLDAKI